MYIYETTIRLRETDAGGVMFFARRFDLMHDAYEAFLTAQGLGIARILEQESFMLPVVHAECDYSAPLRAGDVVSVTVSVEEMRSRRFTIAYTISAGGKTAGAGKTIHVAVDKVRLRAVPLPESLKTALTGSA